jgi:hypothetical protein
MASKKQVFEENLEDINPDFITTGGDDDKSTPQEVLLTAAKLGQSGMSWLQ